MPLSSALPAHLDSYIFGFLSVPFLLFSSSVLLPFVRNILRLNWNGPLRYYLSLLKIYITVLPSTTCLSYLSLRPSPPSIPPKMTSTSVDLEVTPNPRTREENQERYLLLDVLVEASHC